jgi:3-oxoacyl-[acyl-carrier protein] reductase
MSRFKGKRILITGGSQGIGRACAELMASEGGEIVGSYIHDDDAAKKAEEAIRSEGGRATMIKADMGEPADLERLWVEATKGGGIDVLILNAAFQKKATADETDLALMEKTFRVNVTGNFQLAKLFIAARRKAKLPGSVVIHSSNQGEFVNPTGFAYGLSKAALNHMVRHLARSVVKENIRINGVVLGWFDTDGERKFYSSEQIKEQAKTGIPMGRAGDPLEAARMTAFLASDDSSYMTGSLVRFDGGFALAPDLST